MVQYRLNVRMEACTLFIFFLDFFMHMCMCVRAYMSACACVRAFLCVGGTHMHVCTYVWRRPKIITRTLPGWLSALCIEAEPLREPGAGYFCNPNSSACSGGLCLGFPCTGAIVLT